MLIRSTTKGQICLLILLITVKQTTQASNVTNVDPHTLFATVDDYPAYIDLGPHPIIKMKYNSGDLSLYVSIPTRHP